MYLYKTHYGEFMTKYDARAFNCQKLMSETNINEEGWSWPLLDRLLAIPVNISLA
jgi:hypothetical protein